MNGALAITQAGDVDLIADSLSHPLAIAFSKTSSPNYGAAVELAMLGSKYAELALGKSILHLAAFAADRLHMSRALALLRYIKSWKSTQIYAAGKLLYSAHSTEQAINCYLTAAACNDYRAHCHQVISNPFADSDDRIELAPTGVIIGNAAGTKRTRFGEYMLPCRNLTYAGAIYFRLDRSHDVSSADQIQAVAVSKDCAWCPNFKPGNFRRL
jgi:hypothetical protein